MLCAHEASELGRALEKGRARPYQRSLRDEPDGAAVVLRGLQVLIGRAGHNPHRRRLRHEAVLLHAAQQPPQIIRILPKQNLPVSSAPFWYAEAHIGAIAFKVSPKE